MYVENRVKCGLWLTFIVGIMMVEIVIIYISSSDNIN